MNVSDVFRLFKRERNRKFQKRNFNFLKLFKFYIKFFKIFLIVRFCIFVFLLITFFIPFLFVIENDSFEYKSFFSYFNLKVFIIILLML